MSWLWPLSRAESRHQPLTNLYTCCCCGGRCTASQPACVCSGKEKIHIPNEDDTASVDASAPPHVALINVHLQASERGEMAHGSHTPSVIDQSIGWETGEGNARDVQLKWWEKEEENNLSIVYLHQPLMNKADLWPLQCKMSSLQHRFLLDILR